MTICPFAAARRASAALYAVNGDKRRRGFRAGLRKGDPAVETDLACEAQMLEAKGGRETAGRGESRTISWLKNRCESRWGSHGAASSCCFAEDGVSRRPWQKIENHVNAVLVSIVIGFVHLLVVEAPQLAFLHADFLVSCFQP